MSWSGFSLNLVCTCDFLPSCLFIASYKNLPRLFTKQNKTKKMKTPLKTCGLLDFFYLIFLLLFIFIYS